MVIWLDKNKSLLNPKDSEKNNKEIKKLLLLSSNKENKEEQPTRLEDNKLPKELKSTKPNIKLHKELKLLPEDKPS